MFIVASELHGTGTSRQLYDALEAWMLAAGAAWVRLGVVQGNAKAERFWSTCGYVQVRQRGPVEMGLRSNLLRVMVKPLASGTLADYGLLVARDRPE